MRSCIGCGDVKFWWQFPSESCGYYTRTTRVCRRCAKRLMWSAIGDLEQARKTESLSNASKPA